MQPTYPERPRETYLPHIDGLRAVAVVAVVLFHLFPHAIPSGYIGVDVFFVISGYVITKSLLANRSATLVAFLASFYARRVRRLLPALVACVSISILGYWRFSILPRRLLPKRESQRYSDSPTFIFMPSKPIISAMPPSSMDLLTHGLSG